MIGRSRMKNAFITLYRSLFARPQLASLNTHLFKLHLRTLGVLNSETEAATGEPWFVTQLNRYHPRVIVDVGANDHAYGQDVFQRAAIFAFEPHPTSFKRLQKNKTRNVVPIEAAVGEKTGTTTLWDFADTAPRKHEQPTSQLASIHQAIITDLYQQPTKHYTVDVVSLDDYFKTKNIQKIDLLKIDAEGNELAVLHGAQHLIANDKVQIVQFEFNETHAYSHVLFKDFYDALPGYSFYRLLPEGLLPLGPYKPLTHEVFGFQNIVAVHPSSSITKLIAHALVTA